MSLRVNNHHTKIIYALFCTLVMFFASQFLDIPPLIGNWEEKAWSILKLDLHDNYYPPGAAIALIPFLWAGPNYLPAIYFYYFLSAIVYFLICRVIPTKKLRIIGLLALPTNTYLTWLCLSSADQVIELFALLMFAYSALKKRFAFALFFGFFLCFTRPSYWVAYVIMIYLLASSLSFNYGRYRLIIRKISAIIVLVLVLLFNKAVFNTVNLATSSSDTIFYSHQKYHYLALPKFDMDVFLENGPSTDAIIVSDRSESFEYIEDKKIRAALISIKENPQRFIFSQTQKIDSYFFPIQKVPNLPGAYQLSTAENSIMIGNERLSWSITIGHMLFALYRAVWMLLFAATLVWLAILIYLRVKLTLPEKFLLVPFFAGIIPGFIFYVETRFKITSELLAVPLFMYILANFNKFSKGMYTFINRNRD
jgi:hypothetical protein